MSDSIFENTFKSAVDLLCLVYGGVDCFDNIASIATIRTAEAERNYDFIKQELNYVFDMVGEMLEVLDYCNPDKQNINSVIKPGDLCTINEDLTDVDDTIIAPAGERVVVNSLYKQYNSDYATFYCNGKLCNTQLCRLTKIC